MSDFTNTIDEFGDESTFANLLARTITDFKDDVLKTVGACSFYNNTGLLTVNLPNVTQIATSAFSAWDYGSMNITMARFGKVTIIYSRAFQKCKSLVALVIETESVCTLYSTTAFTDTPIASGTGYIYVPSALIEDYKVATNWSTYADQFRALEDYTVDGTITGELDESKI